MTRYFQYVEGGSGGVHPELYIVFRQGETNAIPEMHVQDFEQSPNFIETPDAKPLTGKELKDAIRAKRDAYTRWSRECEQLYARGIDVNDHPPFTLKGPGKAPSPKRTKETSK